jgi:NitT/TauT family transport system permease protein
MKESVARVVYPLCVAIILIGLWQGLVTAFDIPPFLVPSPAKVAQTMVADAGLLFGALYNTLRITLFSFIAAVVVGVIVAATFVQSRAIETAFFPYASSSG